MAWSHRKLDGPLCDDWCCASFRTSTPVKPRGGLWTRSAQDLIRVLERKDVTDDYHKLVKVAVYIEVAWRTGLFYPEYPRIVWMDIFGPNVPPPTSDSVSNVWFRPRSWGHEDA